MSQDDFFIGWADTPRTDRRFFLGAGLALLGGTGAIAAAVASAQNRPGPGTWAMGDVREWRGFASAAPYPILRLGTADDPPDFALLGCQGKCGVSARIGSHAGTPVIVKGSLIERGPYKMIAVVDGMDWIRADEDTTDAAAPLPDLETLGEVTLRGEILDSKCWFGAMSPNQGKVHKACASLCIRGGIPPAFYVQDRRDQKALMIMTDSGLAHSRDLLEFVADPVEIAGTLQRQGPLFLLDSPVSAIRRV
ncbi:MAG: hypothetical protein QNI84_15170 [Henriciella sp.]|nr:hypothetical protein [Henriciella sp.]